jgi:beta-glucosidase
MTFNEPQCFIGVGHHEPGIHAPGDRLNLCATVQAGHHVLLAHGRAVQAMRATARQPLEIGWAPVGVGTEPETNSDADIAAARTAMFSHDITSWSKIWNNVWWGDPVVFGTYPEAAMEALGADAPVIGAGDMELIHQPIDFYGANIYNAQVYRAGSDGEPEKVDREVGFPHSLNAWKVTPGALYWAPRFYAERYRLPIVVTENGLSCHDWVSVDGAVKDPARIDFLTRYLRELRRAIYDGVDVRGYFLWTLMDNFEWAEGYNQRFGLIHVDFETLKRTPKDSARWYREVIESGGDALGTVAV